MSTQLTRLVWILVCTVSAALPGCQPAQGGGGTRQNRADGEAGGGMITLSAPDLEGAPVGAPAYAWTQVEGPEVELDDPTARTPSFPAPAVEETTILGFEVQVTAGGTTLTFDVEVVIRPAAVEDGAEVPNSPPLAEGGAAQMVPVGAAVTLDATGSTDPDGDELTFGWTQVFPAGAEDADEVALSDAQTPTASFVAEQEGTYSFAVDVSDGQYTITALAIVAVGFDDFLSEMIGSALMTELRVYDAPEGGNRIDGTGAVDTGEPCWLELGIPWMEVDDPEEEVPDIPLITTRTPLTPEACQIMLEDHRQIQGGFRGYLLAEFIFDNDAMFDLYQDDFGTGTMYDDRFMEFPTRAEPEGADVGNLGAGGFHPF